MRTLVLGLLAFALTGCLRKNGASQLRHDFGMWSDVDDSPSVWFNVSRDDFLRVGVSGETYPDNHPRVKRLQAWVDTIHQEIMAVNPKVISPNPVVMLVRDSTPSAQINTAMICLPVHLKFNPKNTAPDPMTKDLPSDAASTNSTSTNGTDLIFGKTEKQSAPVLMDETSSLCVPGPADIKLTNDVMHRILDKNYSCLSPLSNVGNGANSYLTGILDNRCLKDDVGRFLGDDDISTRLSYRAMTQYILVTDGLFLLAEDEMVSVIAHELGHYYRGHTVSTKRRYDYFYQLDSSHNFAGRPNPLSDSDARAQLGQEAVDASTDIVELYPVAGQKLHSAFFSAIMNNYFYFGPMCQDDDCKRSCNELSDLFQDDDEVAKIIGGFPQSPLPKSQTAQDFYRSFEEKTQACTNKIPWASVNQNKLKFYLADWPVNDIYKNVKPNNPQTLGDYFSTISTSIGDLLAEQNKRVFDIYKQADAKRIGFYTAEQEADELGLEIIARLGIDITAGARAFLKLLADDDATVGTSFSLPGIIHAADCQKGWDSGFKSFVPIADYGDKHHSLCFRVYNLYREMQAHKSDIAKVKPITPRLSLDPKLWQDLTVGK